MDISDFRFEQACNQHDAGRTQAAIDLLTELLAEDPDNAAYHGLLASCLIAEKRLVAAAYENDIALKQDPSWPFLHEVRARLLLLNDKADDALEACDEALRLDPELTSAHLLKATIYSFKQDRAAAKASLDAAAALSPGSASIAIAYGDYFNEIGEHGKAYECAAEALRIDAGNVEANILMGETQLALGKTDEAINHAKFAIMQDPASEEALRLFAHIKMRNNWFIGAWWRFNSWISTLGNAKAALVLIGGFLGFNLFSVIAGDLGYPGTSRFLSSAWLILVVYSWVGIPMYRKALDKELAKFSFNPRF